MNSFITLLFTLVLFLTIASIVKPSLTSKLFKKELSRKQILIYFFIIWISLVIITSGDENSQKGEEVKSVKRTSAFNVENRNNSDNIEDKIEEKKQKNPTVLSIVKTLILVQLLLKNTTII